MANRSGELNFVYPEVLSKNHDRSTMDPARLKDQRGNFFLRGAFIADLMLISCI